MASHVVSRSAMAYGPHNYHPHVFPTTAIRMWSPEMMWTKSKSQQLLSMKQMDRLSPYPETVTDYSNLLQYQENVFQFHCFLREI